MKSKELKNYNLPDNRTFNQSLEAKPMRFLVLMMLLGFILLLAKRYTSGVALFFFGAACLIFLPNRRMIEFYDNHMIVYNKARKDECNIIYYEDVKSWEYRVKVSCDELIINMEDGTIQKVDGFSKSEYENCLNKYIKDKKIQNENRSNRLRNSKR